MEMSAKVWTKNAGSWDYAGSFGATKETLEDPGELHLAAISAAGCTLREDRPGLLVTCDALNVAKTFFGIRDFR